MKWLDSGCFCRMWGCRAPTCHSFAKPHWYYTSCLLLLKNRRTIPLFPPSVSCCQSKGPGQHPSLPPLWDLTSYRVERGSASFPKRRLRASEGGREEGRSTWLAPSLPWEEVAEKRPKIFTENTGVPSTFSPSKWESWGGVERDFTTKHRGGNGLDGYVITPSSAPPFSF